MNGGLSQDARILRLVDAEYSAEQHREDLEAFNRATHPDAIRELQLRELADRLQVEDRPPTAREVLGTVGLERIAIAAIIATTIWLSTAAFAVAFGGGQ